MDNASSHADLSRSSVPNGLHVIDSHQPPCVITSQKFAKGSRFGPFLAKKSYVPIDRLRFPLVLFGNTSIADDLDIPELSELFKVRNVYLDTSTAHECNWMVHVTPASFRNEQNLIAYQEDNHIYFMSIQDIEVGDVLKVWYAPTYAAKMYVPLLEDSQHQIANNILQHISAANGGGHQQQQQQPHPMGYQAAQSPGPIHHNAAIALPPIQSIINKSSYQKTDYNPAPASNANPTPHHHHHQQHQHQHHQHHHQHHLNEHHNHHSPYNMHPSSAQHRLAPSHHTLELQTNEQQQQHHPNHHHHHNHHPPPPLQSANNSSIDDDDDASGDELPNSTTTSTTNGGGAASAGATPAKKRKVYQCEMCDKKYATMTNIYKHMRSHQLYLCSLCMRTFPQEHQIKEHKCPQGTIKTPQCHVCFKYLSNSWSLTRHMKIHAHELDEAGVFRGTTTKVAAPTATTTTTDPIPSGVRVHEVDISEATSCSLATSCSSDLNQTSSDVLMMGGGEHNSQDFIASAGGGGGSGGGGNGSIGGGGPGAMMDDDELDMMAGVVGGGDGDGEVADGGVAGAAGAVEERPVECSVCAKTFKNEMRMIKHQRQVHSARIKQIKPAAISPGNGAPTTPNSSTITPSSAASKPKRVPPTPMFPQNLAPPVTPDVAKALATKLNERSTNHINAYQPHPTLAPTHHHPQHHLLHPQQHLQTHLQSPPSTPTLQHPPALQAHHQQSPLPHQHQHLQHQQQLQQSPSRPPLHLQPPPHQQLHHQLLQQQQQHIQQQQQQHQQQQQQQQQQHHLQLQHQQHQQLHPQHHPSHPQMHHPQQPLLQHHQQQQQQQQQPPTQLHHQPPPHSFNGFTGNGGPPPPPPPGAFQRQHSTSSSLPPLPTPNGLVSSALPANGLHDEYGRLHLPATAPLHQPQHLAAVADKHRLANAINNGFSDESMGATESSQHDTSSGGGAGAVLNRSSHEEEEEGKPPAEPYTCDVCHKVFQKKNQLTKHRPIHDNTQFVCPFCPNAKSVKSKSTMQKHLRSVHEDRADQWKSPGFVNGLVTFADRPLRGGGGGGSKSKKSQAKPPTSHHHHNDDDNDFDSDTNNNLHDPSKKRKAGSSSSGGTTATTTTAANTKKRTKKDHFDMCDEIDSSSPMILPGDDISAPMFSQHRHLPNNAANSNYMMYDGENARSGLLQPTTHHHHHQQLQLSEQPIGVFNGNHKQLDRFHQTLESLEIVESNGMLNGQLTMSASNGGLAGTSSSSLQNGGALAQHNHHQVPHLQSHSQHGLISWGDRLTAVQANPTTNVTPMTANASTGGGVTSVEGGADEESGYGHFYEDYMVL